MMRQPKQKPSPTVLANCLSCGEQSMPASAIHVDRCITTGEAHWAFRCPQCGTWSAKPASMALVLALSGAGARVHQYHAPVVDTLDVAPITGDDLIEAHFGLDRELTELFGAR